jgi:acyl-CoA synthetase (AMP-forming)/AMP-acid ligase II
MAASTGTLQELLERAATSSQGVEFLDRQERGERWTYDALLQRARRAAAALASSGVRPGERVAIILPTGPPFYHAFFGTILAGAVPVPLYPPVRLGRLNEYHARTAQMIRAVDARLVVTDARVHRFIGPTIEQAQPELGCITAGGLDGTGPAPDGAVAPDAMAFIQFSSGTTGAPRPVCLTHRQVLANVDCIRAAILDAYPEGDGMVHRAVSWLPLYHDMGLIGCLLVTLSNASELVLLPPELFVSRPVAWLRAISRYAGTVSPAPNFAYALCADRVSERELRGLDLSSWRVALNGAEPVTPTVLERFVSRFAAAGFRREALTPVYGLSEAALAVTFSDLDAPFRWESFDRALLNGQGIARVDRGGEALVSLGRPLRGFDIRIGDHPDAPFPEGVLGSVHVRGPSVMQEYLGMPEETGASLRGEWLDTGDLGFLYQGELYLYGRLKEIIVLRGRNHAPQEVEQALDGVTGVRTGCVVAIGVVRPEGDGEELVVLVERRRGKRVDDRMVEEAVRSRLAERTGLVPSCVRVLEPGTLPRTSSGKMRRQEARRRFLGARLDPPAPTSPWRMVTEMARSRLAHARVKAGRDHCTNQ